MTESASARGRARRMARAAGPAPAGKLAPRTAASPPPPAPQVSLVDPEFTSRVSVQSYAAPVPIAAVALVDLQRYADDGGALVELARLADGRLEALRGFEVRQVSYSVLRPGSIKAFHLHLRQSEIWFVPPEFRLLVGLLDVRRGSPTARLSMRFVLGDGKAQLLSIPAGVAHGVANRSGETAPLIYFADWQFTPEPGRCDEHRLPWDTLGADFWDVHRE